MRQYIAAFNEPEAETPECSGGKGASLAKLTRAGFPVPAGFIVTSHGYSEFIAGLPEVESIVAALPFGEPDKLVPATAALRQRLLEMPLPEILVAEVAAALKETGDGAYSVRSSSTLEDLAGVAFAGQHDTYLNCSGKAEICACIRDCFISLWQDRAVAYRHSRGFDPHEAKMAVVVQRMVQCEVAGVGFSVDPILGRDAMLINANYGLGESVVGGTVEVDQFVIDRNSGNVVESFVAHKTVKVVSDAKAGQGTHEIEIADAEADAPSLDGPGIAAVCELMRRVEAFYRFPQDIEWGIEKDRLYLLQARPITSIAPRWTRDESAERYPNAMTPMSWDLIEEGFHKSLDYSFRLMGFPTFDGKWFAMFDNYIYGNQNAVRFYLGILPFAPSDQEELRAGISDFVAKYDWALTLPSEWMRELDRYLMRIGALNAEPLEKKTSEELWDYVVRVSMVGGEYFKPNIAISVTQSVLYRSLLAFIRLFAPDRALNIFDRLTAYCETKTSLVNRELRELAGLAHAEGAVDALMQSSSEKIVDSGMLRDYPRLEAAFDRFLADHGHREIEFDPYVPTWLEAPWVVLDNIRLILMSPQSEEKRSHLQIKRSASQAESELFALLPEDVHLFFREIIRLVRLYTELDDVEHYQTTRMHLPMRRGLRALGRSLTELGILDEPMDIFFARKSTAEACASGKRSWKDLAAEVEKEKCAYLANKNRAPEWILGAGAEGGNVPDTDELVGLAGSPGVAEGTVYIVGSSDDFASFPRDAVLVARTTNPAWTPLFHAASALVTESGGPLSHGAVTAREMKIPAVMSVRGVLEILKNGDRVRVDGNSGRIVRLDLQS